MISVLFQNSDGVREIFNFGGVPRAETHWETLIYSKSARCKIIIILYMIQMCIRDRG